MGVEGFGFRGLSVLVFGVLGFRVVGWGLGGQRCLGFVKREGLELKCGVFIVQLFKFRYREAINITTWRAHGSIMVRALRPPF